VVLGVEHVTLEFEGLRVLADVSFGVDEGTLTALVGPNGAGKTSLLNCVSGFYVPTRGGITFRQRRISGEPPHRVAAYGVARVFQFIELFRHMSVLDNILLGRHRHMRAGVLAGSLFWGRSRREETGERRRVEEVIEFLELERYRKEPRLMVISGSCFHPRPRELGAIHDLRQRAVEVEDDARVVSTLPKRAEVSSP